MSNKKHSFRVGHVKAYLRGQVWYLCYFEHGIRRRPRVGTDLAAVRRLAAETNAQLEAGAPTALSFEPISIPELRLRWLSHHEQVLRSSVQTIRRYRSATEHLVRYIEKVRAVKDASRFRVFEAEDFVRYLRNVQVSSNGHPNTAMRTLFDKGLKFVLEACRAMFNYAAKRRHLSPYAPNPFAELQLDRIPVEQRREIVLLAPEMERTFLEHCSAWQFPVFLTLMLTGMRPGELAHLLLPDDLDFVRKALRIRNRPGLGWQVKTRNERTIPLCDELVEVLKSSVGDRKAGPVFVRRPFFGKAGLSPSQMEAELHRRITPRDANETTLSREAKLKIATKLWRECGALKNEQIRREYMRVCRKAKIQGGTSPKALRHLFATTLQSANVDPLIRMELMGHARQADGSTQELGMTAAYTHTQPEVRRRQLLAALAERPALGIAGSWLDKVQEINSTDAKSSIESAEYGLVLADTSKV